MTKHIFVTGAWPAPSARASPPRSLGRLLKTRGLRVTMQKLDPYINVDPGHDEPVRARRGLRHRRRRRDRPRPRPLRALHRRAPVPRLERHDRLDLLRRCSPPSAAATTSARPCRSSRTSPTRSSAASAAWPTDDVDVVITEVGGTVGDIEILPFLEAIRQFRLDVGRDNVCYVHVTLVPFIGPSGEQKTKPTQHSVTELRSRGIQPDVIVCRSERPISDALKRKISNLCDVPVDGGGQRRRRPQPLRDPARAPRRGPRRRTSAASSASTEREPRPRRRGRRSSTASRPPSSRCASASSASTSSLPDAYLSVVEALKHAGFHHGADVEIDWIQAEDVEGLLADGPPARPRRHRHPRRLRRARHRGQDRRRRLRPRARHPVPRPVPRPAGDDDRVRPQRRSASPAPTRASSTRHARTRSSTCMDEPARRHRQGRHDAPRRLLRRAASRARSVARAYGEPVVSERHRHRYEFNPALPQRASRTPACAARALRPTAGWSSSSSSPTTRSGSARRPTPSSRAGPTGPHPLFRELDRRRAGARRGPQPAPVRRASSREPAVERVLS